MKFTHVVDNDTTVHDVHTYTVAFSPSVLVKCSVCPCHQLLMRTLGNGSRKRFTAHCDTQSSYLITFVHIFDDFFVCNFLFYTLIFSPSYFLLLTFTFLLFDTPVEVLVNMHGRHPSQAGAFCQGNTLSVILAMLTGGTFVLSVMLHAPHMCLCNHHDG